MNKNPCKDIVETTDVTLSAATDLVRSLLLSCQGWHEVTFNFEIGAFRELKNLDTIKVSYLGKEKPNIKREIIEPDLSELLSK